jgi:hypothetical protein
MVSDFSETRIIKIAAGWNHSLALTEGHLLYSTGHGEYGQLGLGDVEMKKTFTLVHSIGNK